MPKIAVALLLAVALAGCNSAQNALQVQAKADFQAAKEECESSAYKTHLAKAKCQNNAFRRTEYASASNKDLVDQMLAQREVLAAKIDRHQITKEDADLQLAQFKSGLVEQENQRQQSQQEQRRVNTLAALAVMQRMSPPPQPLPVYQAPIVQPSHINNCVSTAIGTSIYTNCN